MAQLRRLLKWLLVLGFLFGATMHPTLSWTLKPHKSPSSSTASDVGLWSSLWWPSSTLNQQQRRQMFGKEVLAKAQPAKMLKSVTAHFQNSREHVGLASLRYQKKEWPAFAVVHGVGLPWPQQSCRAVQSAVRPFACRSYS